MRYDIAVVGAGPAGLAFAGCLAGSGLRVALVDRQEEAALAGPAFDGREIALNHRSMAILRRLGAWERLPEADISPLRRARVMNGFSPVPLRFAPGRFSGAETLGTLVPNHLIRRSLFAGLAGLADTTLFAGVGVTGVTIDAEGGTLALADGRALRADLVVAADTRFSETRRRVGIAANFHDFGKTMLVCRMEHERDNEGVAQEWFGYGQTFAILPLNNGVSGAVLTLPAMEMEAVMALEGPAFDAEITRRWDGRLGRMHLVSPRCTYPLVGVLAERFVARRFALLGDAAVGMHPVTAHGFNLGLAGAELLARRLREAVERGRGVADGRALARYEAEHRIASLPLYWGTNTTVRVFTDDRPPLRLLRSAGLAAAEAMLPLRQAIAAGLTRGARG